MDFASHSAVKSGSTLPGWIWHQHTPVAAVGMNDSDADGYSNKCENKYNTNPLNPLSFPGQGELCNQFD